MSIINAHCHIFPNHLAQKAVESIGAFYDIPLVKQGICEDLIQEAQENNIAKVLVHSTATKPEQVTGINQFILDSVEKHEELIGFGTLHPHYENLEQEFQKILQQGLKGIKIHSDFQEVNLDDPAMDVIYELVGDQVPILFHVGDPKKDYAHPKRLKRVMDRFPALRPIAAHMGGYTVWNEALDLFEHRQIWYDTCSSFYYLTDEKIQEIISRKGTDYILFGTDYPMWNAKEELKRLFSLGYNEETLQKILSGNCMDLLKLR